MSRPVNFNIKKELKKMKKFFTIILLSIFAASLYAGDVARKGTTGAEQLLIPVGARGLATGGIPADALVLRSPAQTALNRTCESRLNDFARNASDESRAALAGAMYP